MLPRGVHLVALSSSTMRFLTCIPRRNEGGFLGTLCIDLAAEYRSKGIFSLSLSLSVSVSLSLCLSLSVSLSLFLSVSMKLLCAAEHAAQRHKETWWIRQEIVRLDAEIYKANLITIHVDHSTKYCTDSFKTPKWRKSAEKMCLILRGNYRLSNGVH